MAADHGEFTAARARRARDGAIDREYCTRRAHALRAATAGIVLGRLNALLGSLLHRLIARHSRLRLRNVLAALDRRMMQDLGISRGDIDAIASGDFFRDPTRRRQARDDTNREAQP